MIRKLTKAEAGRLGGFKGGKIGGRSTSGKKAEAARRNGKLGGRPPKPVTDSKMRSLGACAGIPVTDAEGEEMAALCGKFQGTKI